MRHNSENRIVHECPDVETTYHIGTYNENKEFTFDKKTLFDSPTQFKFESMEELLVM